MSLKKVYNIVGIGANVCDTLISLDEYPLEDTKRRAQDIVQSGGGPCATGLVAAAKLGENCAYIGALADDAGGSFLLEDNERYGVSNELVRVQKGAASFSSYVLLGQKNASRTCVFHRGDVKFDSLDESQRQAIRDAKLLMVDGNYLEAAIEGARIARESGTLVLYDAGGLYDGVSKLLPYIDILIPSEEYSLGITGCQNADDAAKKLYETYRPKVVIITQGKRGGLMYDGKEITRYPIIDLEVVDSNGSGDVFHGAYAFAMCKGYDYQKACLFSSAVSSLKCTGMGSRRSVPEFYKVIETLKEYGYNEFEEDME
ncbi:MAG: hypothetical protein IJ391_02955 [Clostridia bacterium]|nr:hypothetical protein [Clostridia bacterium]